MFFAVRLSGPQDFAMVFDALDIPQASRISAVARFLDVSPASVKLWLSGKRNPPRAAVIALWHECHHGRAVTSAHATEGARLALNYAKSCEREISSLKATAAALRAELDAVKLSSASGRAVPMNDPVFDRPRPPGAMCTRDKPRR